MQKEELLERIRNAVVNGDVETAKEGVKKGLEANIPAKELLNALLEGMNIVGDLFDKGEYFLPQVMLAADAMTESIKILEPELTKGGEATSAGKVVIGTIEGDIHDIGKNLVAIMLRGNGFEVYDLGKDVPAEEFIKKAKEVSADIIAVSALMSTTTPGQKKVVEAAKEEGIYSKVKIMVGGACTTPEWAEKIGAYYAPDASEAAKLAKKLVSGES